jgi:hypothetical protein
MYVCTGMPLTAHEQKLIHRQTAGFFRQLILFLVRSFILEIRDLPSFFLNLTLVFICGKLRFIFVLSFHFLIHYSSHFFAFLAVEIQSQIFVFF